MIPCLKIKSDDTAMGYVIINKSDFDPRIHTLHESETAKQPSIDEVATNLATDGNAVDKYGKARSEFEPILDTVTGNGRRGTNTKQFRERRAAIKTELEQLEVPPPAA